MKTEMVTDGLALTLTPTASFYAQAQTPRTDPTTEWRERYAYSVGAKPCVCSFPFLNQAALRDKWATDLRSSAR